MGLIIRCRCLSCEVSNDLLNKRFVRLSWILLKAKVKYYLFPDIDNITDSEYDSMEREYLQLCKLLIRENSIQSMVGVDTSRPSVRAVIAKIRGDYRA